MAKTTPKPLDYSGYTIKAGQILDLGGKSITITKPISCAGTICNGKIVGKLAQFDAAINIAKGSDGARIDGIIFAGGSYNGLCKVWGNGARITNWKVLPGTGWAIQVLGSHRGLIGKGDTLNLRRGGIYFGDGTGYGTSKTCDDWVIEDVRLDGADEEAVFRINTARRLRVRRFWFDNTRCRVGKEAAQNRGCDAVFEDGTILAGTSNGQQPNGTPQLVAGTFRRCLIYGYNSIEAGGDVDFIDCNLVNTPTLTIKGKTYTLKTPGNGCLINPQVAARGLPSGKAEAVHCTMKAKAITMAPKKVAVSGGTFEALK